VSRPRRIKTCDKKEKHKQMYIWHSRRTAPSAWQNTMLDTFMRREIDVLDAVKNAMHSRGKSLCITSIIDPSSMIAVEQQPISKTQSQQQMLQHLAQI
jgi:hypothetical protein